MIMKRRGFLKSVGALGLSSMLPVPSHSAAVPAAAVPSGTYKWAEMIVRAHNKCTLGMLQRHLHLDAATASALKSQLVHGGVISARANAYGIHKAVKPLFDGAFLKPHNTLRTTHHIVDELLEQVPTRSNDNAEPDVSKSPHDKPQQEPAKQQQENTMPSADVSDTAPLQTEEPAATISPA